MNLFDSSLLRKIGAFDRVQAFIAKEGMAENGKINKNIARSTVRERFCAALCTFSSVLLGRSTA